MICASKQLGVRGEHLTVELPFQSKMKCGEMWSQRWSARSPDFSVNAKKTL